MNIFLLDKDIKKCAQYHNDRHVNKMILESAQMLSTAVRLSGVEFPDCTYKIAHKNHGSSIWARTSLSNWLLLRELAFELSCEFDWRLDRTKPHKSVDIILALPEPDIPDLGITPVYQGMPAEYRGDDYVEAYRRYYIEDKQCYYVKNRKTGKIKRVWHTWTKRGKPDWWVDCEERILEGV